VDDTIRELLEVKEWINEKKILPDKLTYNEYMHLAVEIGNKIRLLLLTTSGMIPFPNPHTFKGYTKEEAVIVGLFVRIYKLYDALTYHVSKNQGEIATIFTRLIFESFARMSYLMGASRESFQNFILVSYKSTIENYKDLKSKKEKRELVPIEKRILRKIENRIKSDGLKIDELLVNKKWKHDGKTFKDVLSDIGFEDFYHYVFGNQSSFIHGDWYDIKLHHIEQQDSLFRPNYDHISVDPRYILPISIVCLRVIISFLKWNNSDPDNFVTTVAEKLIEFTTALDVHHEAYIEKLESKL